MNKRIQELAEQAGFGEQWFEEHPTGCSLPKPLMLKEYTELIVRECIDVLIDVLPDIVPDAKDGVHPVWHIKEHFGVE